MSARRLSFVTLLLQLLVELRLAATERLLLDLVDPRVDLASVTDSFSSSARLSYSARCTRNATACVCSDWYSAVPAFGNARFWVL